MKTNQLYSLAQIVLPGKVLKYFDIINIKDDVHFESKSFMEPVRITDFPIRDHKVILVIHRKRWTDIHTGKNFSIPLNIDVAAKGSRYSKEFAAILKVRMETSPVTCRTLETFYHIKTKTF